MTRPGCRYGGTHETKITPPQPNQRLGGSLSRPRQICKRLRLVSVRAGVAAWTVGLVFFGAALLVGAVETSARDVSYVEPRRGGGEIAIEAISPFAKARNTLPIKNVRVDRFGEDIQCLLFALPGQNCVRWPKASAAKFILLRSHDETDFRPSFLQNYYLFKIVGIYNCLFAGDRAASQAESTIFDRCNTHILPIWQSPPIFWRALWKWTPPNIFDVHEGALNFFVCRERVLESAISFFQSEPLQNGYAHSRSSSKKDAYGGPYYRIAKGAAFLLLCFILGSFGIVRIRQDSCDDNPNQRNDKRRAAITALALVIGWVAGVYGTILILPGVAELTAFNRRSEDVRVLPIVVSELKFRNIERHVFGADLVEASDDPAFEDGPKALNRVRVDCANNILSYAVIDGAVRIIGQPVIDAALIGREQTDLMRNGFTNESFGGLFGDVLQDASDNASFAADRANDRGFTANAADNTALAAVLVDALAADIGFIDLYNAAKLSLRLDKSGPDAVCHIPSRFKRTKAHVAPQLPRADAFLAGHHQMRDFEPISQRLVRIFEDRPGNDRKSIARRTAGGALGALPMPLAGFEIIDLGIAAARAMHAVWPTPSLQVGFAGVLISDRKHGVELSRGHLMDRLWTTCSHKKSLPTDGRTITHV